MSLNQNTNVENNEEIANQDWPILNNQKVKSFAIRRKFKRVDIDQTAQTISNDAQLEDDLLSERLEDEVVVATTNKENSSIVKPEPKVVATTPQNEVIKSEIKTKEEKVVINKSEQNNSVKAESVPTHTEKVQVQHIQKRVSKIENVSGFEFFKLLMLGLGHLYIEKTQNVLKPVKFFKDNFMQVSIALMHFLIPALMTYGLTTQSEFIINSLASETLAMKVVYFIAFYMFSSFVWITGQVLFVGLFAMIKNSMRDVVKVGQEKI
jgi:hypothetical protein